MPPNDSKPVIEQLGKYCIEKKIAVGGMAEIYLASLNSDRDAFFAIKKILPTYSSDQNLISMLINEAKVTLSLRHPNIVSMYDFGRVSDSYYMAMEFVSGFDLKSTINACRRAGKWIPTRVALYIVMEILEGLAYAHKRRDNFNQSLEIVHRDISPQNVMLSNQGEVKILDFGIAKVRGRATQTQAGMLKGKFSYMSPEQASGEKLDWRTDIFSTGIILFELLTLENPFNSDQDMRTLDNIKKAQYPSPRSLNSAVPKSLERIVAKALQRRPQKRYIWAEEFQEALFSVQKDEVGFAGPVELKKFLGQLMHGGRDEIDVTQFDTEPPAKQYQFAREERTTDVYYVGKRIKRNVLMVVGMLASAFFAGYLVFWFMNHRAELVGKLQAYLGKLQPAATPAEDKNRPANPPATVSLSVDELTVVFKDAAKKRLEALPFERYEMLRNSLSDQLLAHVARLAKTGLRMDKRYSFEASGYRLEYQLAHDSGAIEVLSLVRR